MSAPIHPGDKISAAGIARIISKLRNCSLPKEEWTHGAHLCAGVGILHEVGIIASESEMPLIIRAYNEAIGGVNSDQEGYHHTITLFYLRIINKYFSNRWKQDVAALASELLTSPMADRTYPLQFYSKDRLFSIDARHNWVRPDLQDL